MSFGKRSRGNGSIPLSSLEDEVEGQKRRADSSSWLAPAIGLALALTLGWAATILLDSRPMQPSVAPDGKAEPMPVPRAG
jgi:hypothetical protein